jgi:hypothetical protein
LDVSGPGAEVRGIPTTGNGTDFTQSVRFPIPGSYELSVWCAGVRSAVTSVPVQLSDCGDAAVIGVRGSRDNEQSGYEENFPGRHAVHVADLLRTWHPAPLPAPPRPDLFDDDGHGDGVIGLKYPAVEMPEKAAQYDGSQEQGKQALLVQLRRIRGLEYCAADMPILLVGHSQGAHVIQSVLDQAVTDPSLQTAIAGAVLLASPRFDNGDPTARGTFAEEFSRDGLAGPSLVPTMFRDRVRSYCLAGGGCPGSRRS